MRGPRALITAKLTGAHRQGLDMCLWFVHYRAMSMTDPISSLEPRLAPGRLLARGTCRHLMTLGFATVEELVPAAGLRVDVLALSPKGEIWVIECKSSRQDYMSDRKWQAYLPYCDRYFWAVDAGFPSEMLPAETGLILADSYDAEIIRFGPETKLAPARRKLMTLKFARHAALRLQVLRDPGVTPAGVCRPASSQPDLGLGGHHPLPDEI